MEALQRGLPSAKGVEDAGTAFWIKTASTADMLKLAQGGILKSHSIGPKDAAAPGQNEQRVFHRPLLGLASQHLYLPLWALTGSGASFKFLLQASGADAVVGTVVGVTSGQFTGNNVSCIQGRRQDA